jgi:hypothetical protein
VGIRRSEHFRIEDLRKLTTFDRLADRRQKSLHKFMQDVVAERIQSRIRLCCIKSIRSHSTRSQGYIIPRFDTEVGRQRVIVCGLKLLYQLSDVSV